MRGRSEHMPIIVYHAITGRPMSKGQTIIMGGDNVNGVCERVRCFEQIERGEQVSGAIAELIRADMDRWKKVARREQALERVRRAEFPECPSRMACLYASRTKEEAITWARFFMESGRDVYAVARLTVSGRVFTGDACNCFDGGDDAAADDARARRYWRVERTERPVFETLIDGEIVVSEIVESYK